MEYILSHKDGECIFCEKIASPDDEGNFVLERGRHSFVILNIYPYKTWERRIRKAYNPQAMNLGANIGAPAGAGVIGHFHIHVVPRWTGDTSHMTVISNTKVMPQSLLETYEQLRSSMDGEPE
jgi:ATP adenylyltransferase